MLKAWVLMLAWNIVALTLDLPTLDAVTSVALLIAIMVATLHLVPMRSYMDNAAKKRAASQRKSALKRFEEDRRG